MPGIQRADSLSGQYRGSAARGSPRLNFRRSDRDSEAAGQTSNGQIRSLSEIDEHCLPVICRDLLKRMPLHPCALYYFIVTSILFFYLS